MGVICSNKNKERNAKADNAGNNPPKLQGQDKQQEIPVVKDEQQQQQDTNAYTVQHVDDDKTQTQVNTNTNVNANMNHEDTAISQHKDKEQLNDNKQISLQKQQTINRNNSGNNNLRQTQTKTDKLESKISELELKHTATNTMSNVEQQQQATTPSKKQIVAIDSNVFVSRGAVSPDDTYIKEKIIGKGSYGVVYLVKHKQLHRYFAMKIIKKRNKSKNDEEELMNEINILKKLDHPNILKINDFYSLKNEYSLITEYCQEGELFNEIRAYAPFNEAIAGYYMKQILTAVCYCHGMNVLHRDLKPENILIVKRAKNGCHPIKIIDFGTAKVFSKGKNENLLIGSSYYIAPEVLSRNYTEKCDLWSCGVIMYILLTGRPPFGGNNDEEILGRIKKGKYDLSKYPWGVISAEAKDLIKRLIEPNPSLRLNAEDALHHPWFELKKMKAIDKIINNLDNVSAQKLVNNLKRYKADNALRCAVIAYLVHNNTQLAQAHDAIKLFNKIDTNGDGKIVKEELYNGLQAYLKLEGTELRNEVDIIFNNIDNDHNGYIEYEEFIRAAIDKEYFLNDNFLKFAFNYFDMDRSGMITLDEVTKLFYQNAWNKKNIVAQKQLKKCFEETDINNDGTLSFEEFCQMMKNIINSN
jgi:calcium-dependent protein kinase